MCGMIKVFKNLSGRVFFTFCSVMHIRRGTLPGHFRKVFEEHTSSDVLDKITLANNADTFTTNTVVREHAELGL